MYNRKEKEKELMEHHSGYLDKLNSSYQFTAKTAFIAKVNMEDKFSYLKMS